MKMYSCECIDCGFIKESEEHCREIICDRCGAQMRQANRPGIGDAKRPIGARD